MALDYINGDLFSTNIKQLAHCVSLDLKMDKGIALQFKKKYENVDYLKSQNVKIGQVGILYYNDISIYYLVTKEKYYYKPTLENLKCCLCNLKNILIHNKQIELAIPYIACGLDKMKWSDVSKLIQDILVNSGISVTVYKL